MAAFERLAERHIRTINWPATVHESQPRLPRRPVHPHARGEYPYRWRRA
jgi:hypothetical protein